MEDCKCRKDRRVVMSKLVDRWPAIDVWVESPTELMGTFDGWDVVVTSESVDVFGDGHRHKEWDMESSDRCICPEVVEYIERYW